MVKTSVSFYFTLNMHLQLSLCIHTPTSARGCITYSERWLAVLVTYGRNKVTNTAIFTKIFKNCVERTSYVPLLLYSWLAFSRQPVRILTGKRFIFSRFIMALFDRE
jgi:hypothetical protein